MLPLELLWPFNANLPPRICCYYVTESSRGIWCPKMVSTASAILLPWTEICPCQFALGRSWYWKLPICSGNIHLLTIGASSQNLSLHQKQVVGLWLWREKGEKMIDCCGKTLDEWLAAANVEAAGRKILKQNLCTKARFYKQPNVAANVSSTIVHQKSGGWRLGGYRRTDRRGIAHSSRWISSPFLAAPVQNEVRLHPCSTRAGLTVLNPVLPCWWWENVKCFLQMQQTMK